MSGTIYTNEHVNVVVDSRVLLGRRYDLTDMQLLLSTNYWKEKQTSGKLAESVILVL